MGNKGKRKGKEKRDSDSGAIIPRQKALDFDRKSRSNPNFQAELQAIRKEFSGEKDLIFFRWLSEQSAAPDRKFIEKYLAMLAEAYPEALTRLDKKILEFMNKYSLEREWFVSLRYLLLKGEYITPEANYFLQKDPLLADSILISVSQNTRDSDILMALYEAKKLLPTRSDRKDSASAYSSIEDPVFIDAVKKTELPLLNIGQLSDYERRIYEGTKDLVDAEKRIYAYRKEQKTRGLKETAEHVKFKKGISDREYFRSSGLKGDALDRVVERLKKARLKLR